MHPRSFDWLSSALGLVCLSSLYPQLPAVDALSLDVTNSTSIKTAASNIAYGMMKYYTGNRTGDVPGNLPSPYYWWEAGAMFGHMVEYWYYTGDTTYNAEVLQALQHQVGSDDDFMPANQSKSLGNDDQVFWAFAAMSAAEFGFENPPSDEPQWLALAQAVFNEQAARWDASDCGGGIRWQIFTFNAGYDYKNSISNGGFFQLAARLARYTANDTYADWANEMWDWYSESVLFVESTWKINDGTSTTNNCTDADQLQWTYNYGTWIAGMAFMYNYTENEKWLTRIDGLLNTTLSTFFPTSMGDGIMVEVACEPSVTCDVDQPSFKSFLSRWLAVTGQLVPQYKTRIFEYLQKSAAGAAGQCSGGTDGMTCGREWNTTTWDGLYGVGEQMSALAIVQAMMINIDAVAAPLTNTTGGNSTGDSSAGTGSSSSSSSSSGESTAATKTITTADKAGAGIVTSIILFTMLVGAWWLLFVE